MSQLVRFINFGIDSAAPEKPDHGRRLYLLENGDFATIDAAGIVTPLATDWDSITGKPSTFPPSDHQHPTSDITGLAQDLADLEAADTALGQRVDYLVANLDPAAIDSVAEAAATILTERTDRIAGDLALGLRIDGTAASITGLQTSLTSEQSARTLADADLSSRITATAAAIPAPVTVITSTHIGNGATSTYSVSGLTSSNPSHLVVTINGVTQSPALDYTTQLAAGTITLDEPLGNGDRLQIQNFTLYSQPSPVRDSIALFDDASPGTCYYGRLAKSAIPAAPALPVASSAWVITRSSISASGKILTTATAQGSWQNRASLSYT